MNRRKLVIGASALLALLFFGLTPKLVGMNLRETAVANLFALIPPEYERQLEINEAQFDSGWFGSSAQFDVVYNALGLEEPLVMRLDFDFTHGPLLLTGDGVRFGLAHARIAPSFNSRQLTEALSEIPFDLPQIELNLLTGFDESLAIQLVVAPTTMSESGVEVSFDGLTGTLVAYNDQSAEINVDMGAFTAGEGVNGFSIASLDLNSRTAQLNDLLAPSSAELMIPTLSANGIAAFTASDISIESRLTTTDSNPGQIDIYQKLAVADIDSEYPLQTFTWTSEIKELSTQVIRNYYEMLNALQEQITSGNSSTTVNVDELAQEMLLVLIQNAIVFNNTIDATVYEGDHSVELLISWLGLPQVASINSLSMEQIISALDVELHVSMDLEAIARSPFAAMIDPYVQQGYITLDNGRVLLDITLADEQLVINGEVTPLGNFSIQQTL